MNQHPVPPPKSQLNVLPVRIVSDIDQCLTFYSFVLVVDRCQSGCKTATFLCLQFSLTITTICQHILK